MQEIFKDPVVAADGFTYSRAAIGKWLEDGHDTSPMNNLPLDHKYVCPNMAVRREALEWMKADYRNVSYPDGYDPSSFDGLPPQVGEHDAVM